MNRTSGVARRKAPLDKYTNITNAATVRGLIRSGGPITGSASGVRSISQRDAFETLGQFFVGEALGLGLAAGASKLVGAVAPKIARAIAPKAARTVSGARPMTLAERSASVTRGGRNGVGKIGPSIKPKAPQRRFDPEGGDTIGVSNIDDHYDSLATSYDRAYEKAAQIFDVRNLKKGKIGLDDTRPDFLRPVSGRIVNTRYKGFTETVNIDDAYSDPFDYGGGSGGVDFDMITNSMKKTLDWRAARPIRTTAKVTRKVVRKGK
jgi:hypothetical protein